MALSVEERVMRVVVEQLGVNELQVSPEKSFKDDLGADDLDFIEFIMALESEFDVTIPDDEGYTLTTVGKAVAYIKEHINN